MKNNFDYTSVPPQLIYCDRQHLDDFDVETPGTLNYHIYELLYERFAHFDEFEIFVCDIFNLAYYICTVALTDCHPDRRFGAFRKYVAHRMHLYNEYEAVVYSITLLQIRAHYWDAKTPSMGRLAKSIEKELHLTNYLPIYQDLYLYVWDKALADFGYLENELAPMSDFACREINRKVLTESWSHKEWIEHFGTDEDKILEFITAIGKDEKEQMLISQFMREELHSAFENGAEHEFCFNDIERSIYKIYHADEERAKIDAEIEADLMEQYQQQWDLDYYQSEYTKLKAENEQLKKGQKIDLPNVADKGTLEKDTVLEDAEQRIKELEARIEDLESQLKEANTLPENVTAQQRVRMELARKIMEKAGIDKNILDKWGKKDKAGTLMGTMLDIKPTTCKTYLSDPCLNTDHHKETIDIINPLLEALELDFRL